MLLRLLALVVVLYATCLLILFRFQNRFIYLPTRGAEADLIRAASVERLEPWRDDAGRLIGWKTGDGESRAANRLVVFHGNALSALHRSYFARGFGALDEGRTWQVFLFEYPGFGARPGKPGEASFLAAAGEALESFFPEDDRPVYLLGESIGSGTACGLAARFPERIAGLILVTPPTSLTDVAAHHVPLFPVRLLLKDRHDNVRALQAFHGRAAFLLAGQDEVVPLEFGRRLHDGYSGPKRLWVFETAKHNTIDMEPGAAWWGEVTRFLLEE